MTAIVNDLVQFFNALTNIINHMVVTNITEEDHENILEGVKLWCREENVMSRLKLHSDKKKG